MWNGGVTDRLGHGLQILLNSTLGNTDPLRERLLKFHQVHCTNFLAATSTT